MLLKTIEELQLTSAAFMCKDTIYLIGCIRKLETLNIYRNKFKSSESSVNANIMKWFYLKIEFAHGIADFMIKFYDISCSLKVNYSQGAIKQI